ncbi:MAG: bifunctional riboflavin kinase/FAD synthetase [Ignavibacteriaceae bacterium]|nr:bifunctional riboflavin kinase/FAD synthetase [Ignavibacteriaceae bacterium]
MKVFNNLLEVKKDKNTVLTLGTFDGIHLGHKKIIDAVVEKASVNGGRSLLITFDPHPRNVLSDNSIKLLNSPAEKLELLKSLNIDDVLVINFTKEFSQLSSEEFFKSYIIDKIGIREIVVGYDHHFGKGRVGDEHTLKELGSKYGFSVTKVDAVSIDGINVSSSKIRNAITEGDIKTANKLLGRHYSIRGMVIKGDGRGRTLGFPTANVKLDDETKLLPALGIYAVEIIIGGGRHFGLMSIGKRPTFYNDGYITNEVYIFDFDKDIYGNNVTVNILERIRGEEKFSSPDELINQMNKDKIIGLEIVNKFTR